MTNFFPFASHLRLAVCCATVLTASWQSAAARSCPALSLSATVQAANQVPVANAGPDQSLTLPAGSTTTLAGSGTDADGTIGGYAWTQQSGPNTAGFSSPAVAAPTLTGLVAGSYTFALVVTDNLGAPSPADEVTVVVADAAVTSFTLVNTDTNQDIQLITAGSTLDLGALPTRNLNVRANTSPATVGSVEFALSGTQTQNLTENVAPYALFSDFQGDYFAWTPAVGSYTLTATPYSEAGGGGQAGTPLTITFSVIDPPGSVTSFTLVNADTDQDIQTIAAGATLNLAALPTRNLNIRANVNTRPVGSVEFALSGQQTQNLLENSAPYALFADVLGDYNDWTPAAGSYSLTATPYPGAGGAGTPGGALTISFTVLDPTGEVTSFTLVNADTDQDIQTIAAGATLNLATLPTRNLNIRANPGLAAVGSVEFALSGQQSFSATESVVPYALFGDFQGNYNVWNPAVGSYSLTATPFPAANGEGTAGTALTLAFSVVDQPNPLPVTLTAFTAQAQGTTVEVRWTTATELNNREFIVQRSRDGQVFVNLATIAGQGTTTTMHHYSYLDTRFSPDGRVCFYRLQQIDYDGTATNSPVKAVTLKPSGAKLQVFPTIITDGQLHYVVPTAPAADARLELFTLQGKRIENFPAAVVNSGTLPTGTLQPGTYLLRYSSATQSYATRFIIP